MAENRQRTGFRGPSPEVGKATQFKPGQSGNPGGRPKAVISEWLRYELEAFEPETQQVVSQMVARVLIDKALAGDVRAIQMIAERVEGKVTQPVQADINATLTLGEGMRLAMEKAEQRIRSRS